jgi:hypothetical protein
MLRRRFWLLLLAISPLSLLYGCDSIQTLVFGSEEELPPPEPEPTPLPSPSDDSCPCLSLPLDVTENETRLKGFPKTYGDRCAMHDLEDYPACQVVKEANGSLTDEQEKSLSWCAKKWCYVSPHCKKDKSSTKFFETSTPGGLFYSYDNCGEVDTFSSNLCSQFSSPAGCASMHEDCAFDEGSFLCVSKCKCVGLPDEFISDHEQTYKLKGASPAYGATCDKHDMNKYTPDDDCTGDGLKPKKCTQAWCYVQGENCALTDVTASFFFTGYDLFFSYSNCGGVDYFTPDQCTDMSASGDSWLQEYSYEGGVRGTPSDRQLCTLKPQCAWTKDMEGNSICLPRCKCLSLPEHIRSDEVLLKGYEPHYGSKCYPHDSDYSYCDGWKDDLRTLAWCGEPWCYVRKGCRIPPVESFFFAPEEIFYSYENCGGLDLYNPCAYLTDEVACTELKQCAWFKPDFDNDGDGKNDCQDKDGNVKYPQPSGCDPPYCDKKGKRR